MLKHGPPDNLADALEYANQGTEEEQEDANAILKAITLIEIAVIATPDDGVAIVNHLNTFLERHK